MNPSTLEKLTVIFFSAAVIVFLAAVFYAIKFKVISSFIFEIEQKKFRKKNKETDFLNIPSEKISEDDINKISREYQKLTGTISVRKKITDISILDSIPSEKTSPDDVSDSQPEEQKKTDDIRTESSTHNPTVAVKKRKSENRSAVKFKITESITVIPCTYDDIICIDES